MRHNRGFTLIELLVVIAIIGILAGLLMPVLGKAKARGQEIACINRLKQWGTAIQMYADENQGWLDDIKRWQSATYADPSTGGRRTNSYVQYFGPCSNTDDKMRLMRTCPAVAARLSPAEIQAGLHKDYGMNHPNLLTNGVWLAVPAVKGQVFYNLAKIVHPSEFLLLVDANQTTTVTEGSLKTKVLPVLDRHYDGANVLWADQHASYVTRATIFAQSKLPPGQRPWFQAY